MPTKYCDQYRPVTLDFWSQYISFPLKLLIDPEVFRSSLSYCVYLCLLCHELPHILLSCHYEEEWGSPLLRKWFFYHLKVRNLSILP